MYKYCQDFLIHFSNNIAHNLNQFQEKSNTFLHLFVFRSCINIQQIVIALGYKKLKIMKAWLKLSDYLGI